MAGSTGLEPATSGLTDDAAAAGKYAVLLKHRYLARRLALGLIGPRWLLAGTHVHRTGTLCRSGIVSFSKHRQRNSGTSSQFMVRKPPEGRGRLRLVVDDREVVTT